MSKWTHWKLVTVDDSCRMLYNSPMFNAQHLLYIVISGLITIASLALCKTFAKDVKTKNCILKLSAILTVIIHYSNLWVNYFATGGNAVFEDNHILPIYPCNVIMWMLLIAANLRNQKKLLFQLLGEFCFYAGTVCSIIGIVLNTNFGNTPTLADYDVLKGLLSHSTMLFGCIYMLTGGFIRIRIFNAVSLIVGISCFTICGISVNALYSHFGMESPDGMWLQSNPYFSVPPMLLGVMAAILIFCVLALWELKLPKEQRWYHKLISRIRHA